MDIYIIVIGLIILWGVKKDNSKTILLKEDSHMLKGIAALLVLVCHLPNYVQSGFIFYHFATIGNIPVAIFFMVSGYGLMINYINKKLQKGFWKKRIIPVVSAMVVIICEYMILWKFLGKKYTMLDVALSYVRGNPLILYSWYIITILLFYILFYFLSLFIKNEKMMIFSMMLCITIYAVVCMNIGWGMNYYESCLCFSMGNTLAVLMKKDDRLIGKKASSIGKISVCIILFFIFFVLRLYCYSLGLDTIGCKLAMFIIGNICAILCCTVVLLIISIVRIGNCVLEWLGRYSLEFFLSSGIVMTLINYNKAYIPSDIIFTLLVVVGCILLSMVNKKVVELCRKVVGLCG